MIGIWLPTLALSLFACVYYPGFIFEKNEAFLGWKMWLSPQIFFLLATLIVLVKKRLGPAAIGLHLRRFHLHSLYGLLIAVLIPLLFVSSSLVMGFFLGEAWVLPQKANPWPGIFHSYQTWLPLLVLAPISEELFFRGVVLRSLLERAPRLYSIILSSLLFMASHGGLHLGAFVLGIITASLWVHSKSLWGCMVYHSVANLYAPLMLAFYPKLGQKVLSYFLYLF